MGGKQLGFSDYELTTAKKQTKREKFLSEMDAVVPWAALIALIEPHYPKASKKGGRPPYPLATMLRIHLLQQWYSLSDPAMEEALIETPTMRRFAGIELISDRIPDETTILTFRHLLEKHDLGEQIFETVKAHLSARGMTMRQGTIVDATLIAAPSSTKNKKGERDPEMHQTKKGNQWYFGMKVHAGVDKDSGLIHSVVVTAANVHDLNPAAELLHGDEEVVYGDAARLAPAASWLNSRLLIVVAICRLPSDGINSSNVARLGQPLGDRCWPGESISPSTCSPRSKPGSPGRAGRRCRSSARRGRPTWPAKAA